MTEWGYMEKSRAEEIATEWSSYSPDVLDEMMETWKPPIESDFVRKMRDDLVNLDKNTCMSNNPDSTTYPADLDFATGLYGLFTGYYKMTPAQASDDRIWRFIQMNIVPDLVYFRWKGETPINDERMWSNPRRMWLKTLWWYVHLSLQESLERTKEILSGCGADDISQLVERAGSGYRIELYREIMNRYSKTDHKDHILRKVLKLNVMMCGTVEPLLYEGGIEGYVDDLFKYFKV